MDPVPLPSPPISPTGRALVPPWLVPYLMLALVALEAVNEALVQAGAWDSQKTMRVAITVVVAALGASPGLRAVTKGPALAVLLALALWSPPAAAQVTYQVGPSLPFLEFDPGAVHPVSVLPGAGVQLSISLQQLQRTIGGKTWDLLDLQAMAFGSLVSAGGGQFGQLSAALGVCTMSSLVCVLGGKHVLSTDGAVGGGWFLGLALAFNVALAPSPPPPPAPAGTRTLAAFYTPPAAPPRANTLSF